MFGILTLIVKQWESSKIPVDGFSKHYKDISIKKVYDSKMTLEKLVSEISGKKVNVRAQKMTEQGYSLVYLSNATLPIRLVKGRNLETEDFVEHKNVALIDKEIVKQTYEIDNVRYLAINGFEYEVVGIFEKENSDIFQNSSIFLNMMAEQVQSQEPLEGRYLIDGVNQSNLENIQRTVSISTNKTIFEMDRKTRWKLVSDTLIFPTKVNLIGILFCITGLIYMIYMWLDSINRTIVVVIICGATVKRALVDVLRNYFGILCYGWGIPILFFVLFTHSIISMWCSLILIAVNMFLCLVELILIRAIFKRNGELKKGSI